MTQTIRDLRVAVHNSPTSYSDRWIEYGKEHQIPVEALDCRDVGIIDRLRSFDALLWHFDHSWPTDVLMARHVLRAAETMGLAVFPSAATCWHFDDKIAQKYVLEAVGAPLIPTYVFYDRETAMAWIEQASFPKVFKLRRGAGSTNVILAKDAAQARRLLNQAFGRGFRPVASVFTDARRKIKRHRARGSVWPVLRRMPGMIYNNLVKNRAIGYERGYIYFQDFIPDNTFDTRITVIGDRAFGFTRNVREGDFRASGSGELCYDVDRIHPDCVSTAFDVAKRLGSQSTAFDFVRDPQGRYLICEISYAYVAKAVYDCPGHWDPSGQWHEGHVWPQDAILEDLLARVVDGKRTTGDLPVS